MHDVSRQAEVTDLHYLALREEHVPGCKVPVHTLQKKISSLLHHTHLGSSLSAAQSQSSTSRSHSNRLHLFLQVLHFIQVHF